MADPKDIKKSVEETVNQILSADTAAANGGATQAIVDPTAQVDATAKAMPASSPANGGDDKIKSGSPMSEEQKAEEAKKAKAAADEEEEKKKKDDEAKKAKADEDDKDDKDDKKEKKDKDDKKPAFMKKSLEELKDVLDPDELELVKAWREESEKEAVAKSQEASAPVAAQAPAAPTMDQISEVLKKAVAEGTADIRKALDEKDTLIKGLNDKIEKMASQPAYDRRSISTLETLEKSGANASGELTKSQVLDKMLELQAAGKGVTSHHIAEFEATRNISDPTVRGIVFRELKVNQ